MAPIIIKLIGAALGSLIADSIDKNVRAKNSQKVLQDSGQDDKPVSDNAKSVPKVTTDDSKKPKQTSGNRGDQRADSGVSDDSTEQTGELSNEPDQ